MRNQYPTSVATATIEFTREHHDDSKIPRECVYARCLDSGCKVGPIWGHGDRSVKRALASLTENCECGARFHSEN